MPISDLDRARTRFHMGYPATSPVTTMAQGLPINLDGIFILDANLGNLREEGIEPLRRILDIMDTILFGAIVESVDRFAVKQLGSITTNPDESKLLDKRLFDFACILADQVRAPLYAGCQRYRPFIMGAGGVSNVSVVH